MKQWSVRKTIVISWLLGLLLQVSTVGGLTAYVIIDDANDHRDAQKRRENICRVALESDKRGYRYLANAVADPTDTPEDLAEREKILGLIFQQIDADFSLCITANP